MPRHTLAITGMHCGHCVTKVTRALEDVEGVASVAVFLDEGEAEVDAAEGTPTDRLTAAVASSGYRASLK